MQQNGDPDQSIYTAAVACVDLFDRYLASPKTVGPRRDVAGELLGRFNLWAAYVGAFASPKASLDTRLADHGDVRGMVLELLIMVQRNVTQDLLSGDTQSPAKDHNPAEQSRDDPPFLLGLNAVDAALHRLHSLAVAIRRSVIRSHRQQVVSDASAPVTHTAEELCYVEFVRRRFPNASENLIEHIGRSIHMRGRSMYYQQRHNKKIAEVRKGTQPDKPTASSIEKMHDSDETDKKITSATEKPTNAVPMSETNASKVDKEELHRRVTRPRPSLSQVSRGSSIRESQDERFGYPKKPKVTETSSIVPCPLCSEPLDLVSLTDKKWRDHVDQDLESYVCISEGCKNPFRYFASARDWKDHMQRMHSLDWAWTTHTILWHCDLDHTEVPSDLKQEDFDDKEAFLQHLSKAHGGNLSRAQILARARRGKSFRIREPFTCPFCDCQPDEVASHISEKPYDLLSGHIARHVKALAFISLSYLDLAEDYSESSDSGRKASRRDAATASIRDDAFEDIPPTETRETGRWVEDQRFIEPEELEEPIIWPDMSAHDPSKPDHTLENFAAALRQGVNDMGEPSLERTATEIPDPKDKELKGLLAWLSPDDYTAQQHDLMARHVSGTGAWFLSSDEFQAWTTAAGQTLVCHGVPGAGKTVMTAITVDLLQSNLSPVAYLYCRTELGRQTAPLLERLLRQLCQQVASLPDQVKSFLMLHANTQTAASTSKRDALMQTAAFISDLSNSIESVASTFGRLFILVDALDECRMGTREILLHHLLKIQKISGANLLVTSRLPVLELESSDAVKLPIQASREDISRYLDSKHPGPVPIVDRDFILEEASGSFSIAEQYLREILTTSLQRNEIDAAKVLSTALAETFAKISSQPPHAQDFALRSLCWLAASTDRLTGRPTGRLTMKELQWTHIIEKDQTGLDTSTIPDVNDILVACMGLVVVDADGLPRLFHHAIPESLERSIGKTISERQASIPTSCINFLSASTFAGGWCGTDEEYEERLQTHPFYRYAACNWGHHARITGAPIAEILAFLNSRSHVEASSQVLLARPAVEPQYSQKAPRGVTGLHLAAFFGLNQVVHSMIRSGDVDPNAAESGGQTPLSWAAEDGQEAVVEALLLAENIDVNLADGANRTPLSWSAIYGHAAIAKLLLAVENVDVNAGDSLGRAPLSHAAKNGHTDTAKLLLGATDVDINRRDDMKRTPLSWAAEMGHTEIVKIFLAATNVDINREDETGQTPLSWATEKGNTEIVKLLLAATDIDINRRDNGMRTPLTWAAIYGHTEITKLLLAAAEIDINCEDDAGQTPLSWAARNGHDGTVELLLAAADIDINGSDNTKRTPLSWAAGNGNTEVVKLLLAAADIDINCRDNMKRTPLNWAIRNEHAEIVKLLTAAADIDVDRE